jgi:hypothetical protein
LTLAPHDANNGVIGRFMTLTLIANTNGLSRKKAQTFATEEDRKRLTPSALIALRKIASDWKLTGSQAAALLAISESTWDRIIAGAWHQTFNQDQMTRASALIGIFKGLHLLFADSMADRWPQLNNSGPLFNEKSPVETMMEAGIPTMIDVRRHIDALRGGM